MKLNAITILAPFLLFFSSCDPGHSFERNLQNNTNRDIKIYFSHQAIRQYPTDTVLAKANSKTTLFVQGGLGKYREPINPMDGIDSVKTYIENGGLKKDIMNPDNWSVEIRKRTSAHKYTFTVNNVDIE